MANQHAQRHMEHVERHTAYNFVLRRKKERRSRRRRRAAGYARSCCCPPPHCSLKAKFHRSQLHPARSSCVRHRYTRDDLDSHTCQRSKHQRRFNELCIKTKENARVLQCTSNHWWYTLIEEVAAILQRSHVLVRSWQFFMINIARR